MAQWAGQFSGRTHETKVQELEEAVCAAMDAFRSAREGERDKKFQAICRLCERLVAARLKALKAQRARMEEPGQHSTNPEDRISLQNRIEELEKSGVNGILREFGGENSPGGRSRA